MLRTTPIGPLVKEAGLRPADSLLASRQRRYATRAFELPEGNPPGDGVRNSSDVKSIFGRLSRSAKTNLQHQFSGQEVIETTRIPPSIESITASVIIESRKGAENTVVSMIETNTGQMALEINMGISVLQLSGKSTTNGRVSNID
jgi:hypothetical protein